MRVLAFRTVQTRGILFAFGLEEARGVKGR